MLVSNLFDCRISVAISGSQFSSRTCKGKASTLKRILFQESARLSSVRTCDLIPAAQQCFPVRNLIFYEWNHRRSYRAVYLFSSTISLVDFWQEDMFSLQKSPTVVYRWSYCFNNALKFFEAWQTALISVQMHSCNSLERVTNKLRTNIPNAILCSSSTSWILSESFK